MGRIYFSCWGGRLIDNRGKPAEQWAAPADLKLPFTFKTTDDVRAFMGWDGFFLAADGVSVVALCRAYLEAVQREASCGECFPCRVGTRIAAELLARLCQGVAVAGDLAQLEPLLADIAAASKCQVGQTAPRPVLKALAHFRDEFAACVGSGRAIPPVQLVTRVAAPCQEACPAHLDIPIYVEDVKKRRYLDSSDTARLNCVMPTVLGRVCVRPCEAHCRRANVDEPIHIKYLKRFAADYEKRLGARPLRRAGARSGKRVAVIGAGPAGLACAEKLAQAGHAVVIFEALAEGGGMAAVGIPDYRLPREVLRREIRLIEELGVEIKYSTRLGDPGFGWAELQQMGFDAIFLGVGAHNSNKLGAEGEDQAYKGFVHGVAYLRAVAEGRETVGGKKMVVVGGGNVAIDCVRTALRLGFDDVHIIYRRSRKEMPADAVEIADAEEEGVHFNFLCNPTRLLADAAGRLTGVECLRMELGEPDASGRRRPSPKAGSEFTIPTDVLIPAIGQSPNLAFLQGADKIGVSKWSTIVADGCTGATGLPGVFSGGDCVTGAATLIEAVAAGNRAAISIDRYLLCPAPPELDDRQCMERLLASIKTYDPQEKIALPKGLPRQGFAHLPVATRIRNFDEVEMVMSAKNAETEAARCLRCFRLAGVVL